MLSLAFAKLGSSKLNFFRISEHYCALWEGLDRYHRQTEANKNFRSKTKCYAVAGN